MQKVLLGLVCLIAVAGCNSTTFPNFSHWDSIPSIATFPSKEAPAVIHRSSRGLTVDTAYKTRARQARQRPDILWGAYHFCDGLPVDKQLDWALREVGYSKNGSYRTLMVFDFEKNTSGSKTNMRISQLADLIRKFHHRTSVYPVVYVNPNWFNSRLATDKHNSDDLTVIRRCPLWTSAYSAKPNRAQVFGGWKMWQYAGDARQSSYGDTAGGMTYPRGVSGVGKKLEMNTFRGNVEQLREFWKKHSIPTKF